jgi:hypothetical protein
MKNLISNIIIYVIYFCFCDIFIELLKVENDFKIFNHCFKTLKLVLAKIF